MDFQLEEYSVAKWTPEIGGVFQGMKLKLNPFLKRDKAVFMRELARKNKTSPTNFMEQVMNPFIVDELTDKYLSLIVGWDGCTSEGQKADCTKENKEKFLKPLMDYETGHKDAQGKPFTLMLYIAHFTETLENYQKNSASTAVHGAAGGVTGPGSTKTS